MRKIAILMGLAALAACRDATEPPAARPDKGAPQAARADRGGGVVPDRYIVTFASDDAQAAGRVRQAAEQAGGRVHHVYRHALRGFSATLPAAAVQALENNPHVAAVEPVRVVKAAQTTQLNPVWGLDRIDQRFRPYDGRYVYTQTGAGVTAYILDTGINYSHTEFGGRAQFGFDAVGDGWNGNDCNGHGSHVAGTVGGATYGVAKAVRLVAVRVLDCYGNSTTDVVIAGVDWLTANAVKPAVANLSLGGGISSAMDAAVRRAIAAGIVVVLSAGNEADDACYYSPARVAEAITIGASDAWDEAPYFSNYGACIDFFAPGADITSAWFENATQTATISGTSMAAPHVAGVAAMFLEANPWATPQQVRDKLFEATTKSIVAWAFSPNNHLLTTLYTNLPRPNTPPQSSFTRSCTYLSCAFSDFSTDADGQVAAWAWAFGDGATSTERNPSHAYGAAGSYTVTLTVTDDRGATASSSQTFAVSSPGTPPPPPPPPPGEFVLTVTARTARGQALSDLSWTGAQGASVDVYRNGVRVATTANDGFHTDTLAKNATGPFLYRVCQAGTTTCSNDALR